MELVEKAQVVMASAVVLGVFFLIVWVMVHSSGESCRMDALNAMCGTYAGVAGHAERVDDGAGSFTVICVSDFPGVNVSVQLGKDENHSFWMGGNGS